MPNYDATFIPCRSFGGGWMVAHTPKAEMLLNGLTGERAAFIAPINQEGWVVEPQVLDDVAHYSRAHGLNFQLECGEEAA